MQLFVHLGDKVKALALPVRGARLRSPAASLRLATKDDFIETAHPRDKTGKFAKKNEVSNSIAVPLKQHGFKMKPVNGEAHYEHPGFPGHKVSVKPVPTGFKYSSGWVHTPPSGPDYAAHGSGGVALSGQLFKHFGAPAFAPAAPTASATGSVSFTQSYGGLKIPPKVAEGFKKGVYSPVLNVSAYAYDLGNDVQMELPQPGTVPYEKDQWAFVNGKTGSVIKNGAGQTDFEQNYQLVTGAAAALAPLAAKTKAPPPAKSKAEFTHPNGHYAAAIANAGFTPLKETAAGQTYANAAGDTLLVKTKPISSSWKSIDKFRYKLTKAGKDKPSAEGKDLWALKSQMHQHYPGDPVKPPPGVDIPATPPKEGPYGTINTNVHGYDEPANSYDISDKEVLYLSTKSAAWSIKKKVPNSYTPGKFYEQTVKQGKGQASLNAAFEELHPRGAGGKFTAKPGQSKFVTELNNLNPGSGWVQKSDHFDFTQFSNGSDGTLAVSKVTGNWTYYVKGGTGSPTAQGSSLEQLHGWLKTGVISTGAPAFSKPPVKLAELKKIGEKMGSNEGGTYEDTTTGEKFYVKHTKSADHAKNERVAAALYALAGSKTLAYRESDNPAAVVTELQPLGVKNVSGLTAVQKTEAQNDFAVHAWLANWDAVGLTGDNLGAPNGESAPINLDMGGALAYRAQGLPKGDKFGNSVTEWETLRDPSKNSSAAALFKPMTGAQLKASAERLGGVKNNDIWNAIKAEYGEGPEAMALYKKLAARKLDVIVKGNMATSATKPAPPPPPPEFKAPFAWNAPDSGPSIGELGQLQKVDSLGTASQRAAVRTYTGGSYTPINRALRYGYHGGEHSQAHNIKEITAWLDQASMPTEVVCTRKVDNDYAAFLLEIAKVGSVYTDFGFASTSRTNQWSGSVVCQIKIPKGAKAAAVRQISNHPGEDEVLIQRGSQFKVVDFNPKTKTLYVEMLHHEQVKVETL